MSKRSGFAVKITAFIEADPKDVMSMSGASDAILALSSALDEHHMTQVKITSRFMLSREVPDEPKAVESNLGMPEAIQRTGEMPPIPAPLRRA